MPEAPIQISVQQYVHLGLSVAAALGILAVIIAMIYPVFEKWRYIKHNDRMMELKNKRKRE